MDGAGKTEPTFLPHLKFRRSQMKCLGPGSFLQHMGAFHPPRNVRQPSQAQQTPAELESSWYVSTGRKKA